MPLKVKDHVRVHDDGWCKMCRPSQGRRGTILSQIGGRKGRSFVVQLDAVPEKKLSARTVTFMDACLKASE